MPTHFLLLSVAIEPGGLSCGSLDTVSLQFPPSSLDISHTGCWCLESNNIWRLATDVPHCCEGAPCPGLSRLLPEGCCGRHHCFPASVLLPKEKFGSRLKSEASHIKLPFLFRNGHNLERDHEVDLKGGECQDILCYSESTLISLMV